MQFGLGVFRFRPALFAMVLVAIQATPVASKESIEALGKLAVAGNPSAQVRLGQIYFEDGHLEVAAEWFCLAADTGYPAGLYRCGRALVFAQGKQRDRDKGMIILERAAHAGMPEAAILLGELMPGQPSEEWYGLADRLGSKEGAYRLGLALERRLARQDAQAAFSRAAAAGHAAAMNALALSLLNDPKRKADAIEAAETLLIRAAEAGDQSAQFNLGVRLVNRDKKLAYRYLLEAAVGTNRGVRASAQGRLAELEAELPQDFVEMTRQAIASKGLTGRSVRHPEAASD